MRFFKMNSDETETTENQTDIKNNSRFHMPEVTALLIKSMPKSFSILFLGINECHQCERSR